MFSSKESFSPTQLAESNGHDGSLSATGDSVIVIGAASKGIIQRDQQHNVQVYHTQYAANPFETMSEDEIEKCKWEVEHKGGPDGLPTEQEEQLEPGPEDKLISTEERLQQVQPKVEESAPTVEISEDEASSPAAAQSNFQRSKSARYPPKSAELIDELKAKNFDRSKSERKVKSKKEKAMNGDDDQMRSPVKCDTLRSTDSASGGETLEERSSKELNLAVPWVYGDAVEIRAPYTYLDYTDSEEEYDTFSDETDDENSTYSERNFMGSKENEIDEKYFQAFLMKAFRLEARGYDLRIFAKESIDIGKDEDGNTILHIAASGEDPTLFESLLVSNLDMIDTENKKKRTPLHIAAKHNRHEIADILIKRKAKVFIQDVKALTPLLTAVRYDSLEVFKLLEVQSKEGKMTNWWYRKALEIATKYNSKDVAQYLIQFDKTIYAIMEGYHVLFHSAAMNNSDKVLEILLHKIQDEGILMFSVTEPDAETTGDMSKKQQHKTKPFHVAAEKGHLQCLKILIERKPGDLLTKCEHGKTVLHYAAAKGRVGVVEHLIKKAPGLVKLKDKLKRTPLHDAIKHVKVVEILLTSGAKINSKDKNGRTPLSHAAEKGMLECTTMLVKNGADINLADNNKMGPIHFAAKEGQTQVFFKLASSKKIDLDKSAINCLDLAIDNNHVETVLRIFQIENSKWTKMLRSRSKLNYSDEFHDTPMRKLIRQMPEVAMKVFNHCTKMSKAGQQFEVTFDYEFLDDTNHLGTWKTHISSNQQATKEDDLKNSKDSKTNQSTEKKVDSKHSKDTEKSRKPYTENTNIIKENHPLMIMVTSKRIELLDHPLVSALLKRKWISIGLVLNILICVLYALFLALLTGFTLDVPAPYQFQGFSECSDFTNESISAFAYYARYGIIALALIILLIEILEIKQMFYWKVWLYFLEIENVFEWIVCMTAIMFVVNTSGCSDSGYRPQWQWTCGTISVFLAWINMLFIIQKFEWLGIYVVMLYRIIKVFMKFLFVFSLLIIAFAISFHCLFQNQEPFSTIGKSLMRTTSMMIGGPDFVSTFLDETVHFEIVSYAFFILFMMFMAIVVINLLVGLAVNNIHEFQQKADLSKKEMQVKFALELERMATSDISKKILNLLCFKRQRNNDNKEEESNNNDSTETLKPNELSWFKKKVGESWKLTERDIKAAMSSEKDDYSMMVARLDTLETNLEVHMKYMGTQLAAILEKNEKKTDET